MIIWLNGTFGAGKTATAKEQLPLVPDTRLFDPETVGYMLRPTSPTDRYPISSTGPRGARWWWRQPSNWPATPASI